MPDQPENMIAFTPPDPARVRAVAAQFESEIDRAVREAGLADTARLLKLERQERNQPGAQGIPEQIRYRCVNPLSPCHRTDICIPVDDATGERLMEAYVETRQRFIDAHPFEGAEEMREA